MEQLEASRSIPEPTMTTVLKSALPHLVSFDPGLAITPEKSALSRKGKLSSDKLDILESPLRNPSPKPLKPASGILVSTQELPDKPNSRLKPGILSSGSIDWLPTKLISLSNDPMLDVTPEKPTTSVLKTQRKTIGKNLDASNGEEKKVEYKLYSFYGVLHLSIMLSSTLVSLYQNSNIVCSRLLDAAKMS